MRAIIIFATAGPVVFHTPHCTRAFVDNAVAVVESDIHMQTAYHYNTSAMESVFLPSPEGGTDLTAWMEDGDINNSQLAYARRDSTLVQDDSQHSPIDHVVWVPHGQRPQVQQRYGHAAAIGNLPGGEHKEIDEGMVACFPAEHSWLQDYTQDEEIVLYWRRLADRVMIFALEREENLATAKNSMSTLIVLLSDVFKKRGNIVPLKEIVTHPEMVLQACNAVAPQNKLALVDIHVARQAIQKFGV